MKNLILVISTLADIGKGWLTASIASNLPNSYIIKIDPALCRIRDISENPCLDSNVVSSDAAIYRTLGYDIPLNCIFRGGEVLFDFLQLIGIDANEINVDTVKKLTFADVGDYFSQKIVDINQSYQKDNLVIEMGGSVYDDNITYLVKGVRKFALKMGIRLNIVLLSYLTDTYDTKHPVKSNIVVDGISKVSEVYGIIPSIVFVRNKAHIKLSPKNLSECLEKIAYRSCILRECVIYEPTFKHIEELRNYIQPFMYLITNDK